MSVELVWILIYFALQFKSQKALLGMAWICGYFMNLWTGAVWGGTAPLQGLLH